jgi:TolA-binding protein
MRLGEAAFDAGELERAVEHYRAVAEGGKPEYVDKAFYKLGWCFYNLDDYARAAQAFSRVLEQGRSSPEDLRRETLEVLSRTFLESGGVEALEMYLDGWALAAIHGADLYRLLGDRYLESSRYQQAVRCYAAGVDAYPESDQCLEMERGILQSLLVLREPESANARRESWDRRYGAGSAWDRAHASGPLAKERDSLLEEGLRLAALYRHGLAQRGQGDLDRALALYDRYLELFGTASEEGYEMAYACGQGLREAGRLGAAAARYREVAIHPVWASHREDASYRRIEVLTNMYERQPSLLDELVEAHGEYIALNPGSEPVPRVLFAEGEILFAAERFASARAVFVRVAEGHAGHELAVEALEHIVRCYFREESYALTEGAARRALASGLEPAAAERVGKLLAFAIFKQAEIQEEAGDPEAANRDFFRLADEFPKQEAAPIALYRAAENLRAAGREDEAAGVYERLARSYPESEYAQNALVLSAQIFASLGDWRKAALGYEDLYRASPDAPGAADALFRAARARERGEEPAEAVRLFAEFAARFSADPRVAEARFREGEAVRGLGRLREAADRYRLAWESEAPGDASVYRAEAALARGKLSLAALREVELAGDLERSLARKETLLTEALVELTRAASLPYAETLTESLYRAGEAFEHMKEALLGSERPSGLTEEEREEYDFLLEEKAFPLEERAVGYYRKGVSAAREAGVCTVWVERMFGRLEALMPWAYQRAEEPTLAWDTPALAPAGGREVAQ